MRMTRFPYSIPFSLPELPRRRQRLSVPPEPLACDGSPKFFLALSVKLSADDGMIIACFCRLVKQQSRSFGERRHFQENIDCIIPENFPYVLEMSHSFCYNHVMTEQGRAYLIRRGARGCPKAYAVRLRMRRTSARKKAFVTWVRIPHERDLVDRSGERRMPACIHALGKSAQKRGSISQNGVRAAPAFGQAAEVGLCALRLQGYRASARRARPSGSARCAAHSTADPPHSIGRYANSARSRVRRRYESHHQ